MVNIRVADDAETRVWAGSYGDRLRMWYGRFGCSPEWLERKIEHAARVPADATAQTNVIADGPADVGFVAVRLSTFNGMTVTILTDLWIHPDHRRRGIGTFAREWARSWAGERAGSMFVTIDPDDPAQAALFASGPVRAQTMMKRLGAPAALPEGVEGRPMDDADYAAWREASIREYAESMSADGEVSMEDALVRARNQTDEMLPQGLHTPGYTFWAIYGDDTLVATNWLRHRYEPGISFVYGVETHEGFRGKGYGRAAMLVGEAAALAAGDTHLSLNVFGHNHVAINLYTTMGYERVEQVRSIVL